MRAVGAESVPAELRDRYLDQGWWHATTVRAGLEAHAGRTPERLAVSDATARWTYADLERAVATTLGGLRRHGVGDGSPVLVIAPLIAPAVAAYCAVVRAGGLAVMLDRRCGRADVRHAVTAVAPELVVTTPELAEQLDVAASGVPTVTFDELLAAPADRDWAEPDPDRPVAVVFTSGTTSRPKGVVHSLDTLRAGARSMADALTLTDADNAFLSTPLASITGLVQVHLTLDRGAGLLLEDRFDAAGSLARLRAEGATVLGGAPVILEELFRQAQRQDLRELPLRGICLGGAMIPRDLLELAVDRYGIRPVRIYGSSEIPCATTTRPTDEGPARLGDDGAPAAGVELRLADDPTGELLVRGPMRFLGHLDEQDDAATFLPGGWFRTGDLGRVEDGRLTVAGRLKEVVSRKGLKISLTELDDVLRRLPHATEVVAFGVPDPDTGERLAIALRTHEPDAVEFDAVIDWLLDAGLAKWKLPEQVDLWTGPLPRTTSGKIQRRLVADGAGRHSTLLAPRLR